MQHLYGYSNFINVISYINLFFALSFFRLDFSIIFIATLAPVKICIPKQTLANAPLPMTEHSCLF